MTIIIVTSALLVLCVAGMIAYFLSSGQNKRKKRLLQVVQGGQSGTSKKSVDEQMQRRLELAKNSKKVRLPRRRKKRKRFQPVRKTGDGRHTIGRAPVLDRIHHRCGCVCDSRLYRKRLAACGGPCLCHGIVRPLKNGAEHHDQTPSEKIHG